MKEQKEETFRKRKLSERIKKCESGKRGRPSKDEELKIYFGIDSDID